MAINNEVLKIKVDWFSYEIFRGSGINISFAIHVKNGLTSFVDRIKKLDYEWLFKFYKWKAAQ